MKGTRKQFFAGGNTAYGFYSLFDYIATPQCERLLIIKGGPGTGKSTLMRRIGDIAHGYGLDIELFFCSSDHESLDGLSVPELGFAIVDGTAPHVIDPRLPGAFDEIINLGNCWDTKLLQSQKKEIALLIQENGDYFTQAYQYLKEAHQVMEKTRYLMSQAMDCYGLNQLANRIIEELAASLPQPEGVPYVCQLFAGAISPGGLINFYPSILGDVSTYYLLTGDAGSGKSYLLQRIFEAVQRLGHDVEIYRCAFDPHTIDAIVIPVLKTAFVKATYPHSFSFAPTHHIKEQSTLALSRYLRVNALKRTAAERSECQDRFWYLIGKAVEMIRKSKRNHDQLESYYIQAMDFAQVAKIQDEIVQNLLPALAKMAK